MQDRGAGAESGAKSVLPTGLASRRIAVGLGTLEGRGRGLAGADHRLHADEDALARSRRRRFGSAKEVADILADPPQDGPLFPYLVTVRAGDRATEFRQRCVGLGIQGVTLHSYRYAWAERAKIVGYPERFAQEALGHNSKAVHRAYAKNAQVTLPPLEEYERKIVPLTNVMRSETVRWKRTIRKPLTYFGTRNFAFNGHGGMSGIGNWKGEKNPDTFSISPSDVAKKLGNQMSTEDGIFSATPLPICFH